MRLSLRCFLTILLLGTACVPEDLAVPADAIGEVPKWGEGFTAKAQAQERESLLTMKNVRGGAKDFQVPQNTSKGLSLYQQHCAQCHGAQGQGGQRMGIGAIPAINTSRIREMPTPQLLHIVLNGKGRMPPMKNRLQAKDVESIVQFVKQLNTDPK